MIFITACGDIARNQNNKSFLQHLLADVAKLTLLAMFLALEGVRNAYMIHSYNTPRGIYPPPQQQFTGKAKNNILCNNVFFFFFVGHHGQHQDRDDCFVDMLSIILWYNMLASV